MPDLHKAWSFPLKKKVSVEFKSIKTLKCLMLDLQSVLRMPGCGQLECRRTSLEMQEPQPRFEEKLLEQ
jgi:hypothetical protein